MLNPNKTQEAMEQLRQSLPEGMYRQLSQQMQKGIFEHLANGGGEEHAALLQNFLPELSVTPAAKILRTDYPDIKSLIEGIMTPGVWFVYGKPKVGKSWLASQIALAVGTGGMVFDKPVRPGKVLYLALEDGERRLKRRMTLQQWGVNAQVDYMLPKQFRDEIGFLNTEGGKRLLHHIEKHNYLLTVIDTFSRAINLNQLKSELMTEAISPFQEFAQAQDRNFLFVDHEPKRSEGETTAITGLYGGVAKSGMADGLWRLYKERGKGAKIDIEGRDLEDAYSLKLRFDKQLCFWYSEGDAEAIEITERRKEVLDALANLGKCNLGQLEDATGQAKGHLHTRLQDLVTEGIVIREKKGASVFYELKE